MKDLFSICRNLGVLLAITAVAILFPIFAIRRAYKCRLNNKIIAEESLLAGLVGIICAMGIIMFFPVGAQIETIETLTWFSCGGIYFQCMMWNQHLRLKLDRDTVMKHF